jgi:hypothetical protein
MHSESTAHAGQYGHNGNGKLGPHVSVINREAGVTCPGESPDCGIGCYAKVGHFKRFGIQVKYAASVIAIPSKLRPQFRFHASGDFDTVDYIDWCIDLVRDHPGVKFWAYTRSWTIPHLVDALERLRAEPNMQLFASVDPSMVDPPTDWRKAWIEGDDRQPTKGVPVCMEQTGAKPNCESCGYCFKGFLGDIGFVKHSGWS